MKTIYLVLIATLFGCQLFAQKLADLYKKDVITLEPVMGFGKNNNWDSLFRDYKAYGFGKPVGQMKKIVVAPDGSIFMSHKTYHEIWKFDKNGNLEKKFGRQGGKPGQFPMLPTVEGIFNGKYIYTNDVHGRMQFFDFNGTFIKMLKLDYMPMATVPLKDNKIAILGFVVGKNSSFIVRLKDFTTGDEKQIWMEPDNKTDDQIRITFPHGGAMTFFPPYSHSSLTIPRLAATKSGNLIMASPRTGEIMTYATNGQLINTFRLNIKPLKVTEQDIQKSHENAVKEADKFVEAFKKSPKGKSMTEQELAEVIRSYREQLVKYKNPDLYPKLLPYFSSLIVDSDGNLLVFEFTKDEDQMDNHFRAYSYDLKGNFLGSSSFRNETLDLTFNPQTFQFLNGYVYAIAKTKQAAKMPLRILKLKPQL